MIDWINELDIEIYQLVLNSLLIEFNYYEDYNKDIFRKRIVVMMLKCERGEVWIGCLDFGDDLFRLWLLEIY